MQRHWPPAMLLLSAEGQALEQVRSLRGARNRSARLRSRCLPELLVVRGPRDSHSRVHLVPRGRLELAWAVHPVQRLWSRGGVLRIMWRERQGAEVRTRPGHVSRLRRGRRRPYGLPSVCERGCRLLALRWQWRHSVFPRLGTGGHPGSARPRCQPLPGPSRSGTRPTHRRLLRRGAMVRLAPGAASPWQPEGCSIKDRLARSSGAGESAGSKALRTELD